MHPMPMDFESELKMFALCPDEFIHEETTDSALVFPTAMFSLVILLEIEKQSCPVGLVCSKMTDVSAARCIATDSSSASMLSADSPCFARSWFTKSST